MADAYIVPSWFFGYGISLELIFAVITLVLGIYSFRIYRLSGQRQIKYFGLSFALISVSYFLQSFFKFRTILEINENITHVLPFIELEILNNIGLKLHMMFFLAGLVTLTYMTFKVRDAKIYSIMLILSTLAVFFSTKVLYLFHLTSTILLAYILSHYILNYIKKRKKSRPLILLAFIFLLLGSMDFFFSTAHGTYYVMGHILELIAYLLILANLIAVFRK